MKNLIILFLLLTASIYSQTWTTQTTPTTNDLYGVWFTDSYNGTAVGVSGTILRTTDAGVNWSAQTSNTTETLWNVRFTDANTAFIVGNNGTLLKTTDAGSNWTALTSGTTNRLADVGFTDSNNGTAVGNSGTILRTTDGGTSWTAQTSGTTNALRSIYFQDANTAYIVGNNGDFLKTIDAGTNWTKATISSDTFYRIAFSSTTNAVAVSNSGKIAHTTDGGSSWNTFKVGTLNWRGVYFTDATTGYITGNNGNINKTTDGGANWTAQTSGTTQVLQNIFFTDAFNGAIVGLGGTILKTSVLDATPPTITGVTLASDNSYLDVTWDEGVYNTNSGSGALELSDFLLSISGGTATNPSITSVSTTADGALTGGETTIRINFSVFGTPDGSETLTVVPAAADAIYDAAGNAASTTQSNNSILLAQDALDGVYSGGNGDGYASSHSLAVGVASNLSATETGIQTITLSLTQNASSDNVMVAYTTDGIFGTPTDETSYSVGGSISGGGTVLVNGSITSFDHTFLTGGETYYYKAWSVNSNNYSTGVTNNTSISLSAAAILARYSGGSGGGGASAESPESPLPVELTIFEGYNTEDEVVLIWETATETNNYGFQVQRQKEKVESENQWEEIGFVQGHGTTNSPKNYSFTDTELPDTSTVSYRLKQIDNDGTFAYSKTVEVDLTNITGVEEEEIPIVYSLSQNYPNPFNPTTTIKFGLPEQGFVDLRVYNILGQEVARLANQEMNAGYHEVNFGYNNIASGMYIYRIDVRGKFSSVKKMLLVK